MLCTPNVCPTPVDAICVNRLNYFGQTHTAVTIGRKNGDSNSRKKQMRTLSGSIDQLVGQSIILATEIGRI